ncbi:MAG: UDP-N-acetylglucosamine 4,6-dehydratase family protein, partial [Phycicoccus sp.]
PISLDMAAIAEQIGGKRVLVTGAGGSIGSELCRQISRFGPARLLMLDRDESGLHATQLSVEGQALLDSDDLLLCDIRDVEALRAVFERTRPQVVFHAAALKHLTMLERYPEEAMKTNVVGTLNVLEAARLVDVETFVNISTDKAAQPTSVLGWSKRVAERYTANYDRDHAGRYVSVRFGNVLGSRGSVIPAFMEQIQRGGPVTVTHPEVERYFMLIPEACQLVLQAAAIGAGGEVMVLDMGRPVKILEVANTMIELSGRTDVDIVFTGLRLGEKLSEELFSPGEDARPTGHPLITHVPVPPLSARPSEPAESVDIGDASRTRSWMHAQSAAPTSPAPTSTVAS